MHPYPAVYGIVMAGGIGKRFWPMSRSNHPKQFIDVLGTGKTMIQATCHRLEAIIPSERIYVFTGEEFGALAIRQLPALPPSHILTEPERRNTAPCIAYAAYKLYAEDPDAVMIVTPSDHSIADPAAYTEILRTAVQYVSEHDILLTIGITPHYPATGFGYIELSEEAKQNGKGPILRFKEKPQLEEARELVASGRYVWNSGMFVWKAKTIIQALEKYVPEVALPFAAIEAYGKPGERAMVEKAFLEVPSISIDFGVMEKADNVHVITGEFGWDDVGTWGALARHSSDISSHSDDTEEDSHQGVHLIDADEVLVHRSDTSKRVIIAGLHDYLVVDTEDVLLIAPKSDESELHDLIDKFAD